MPTCLPCLRPVNAGSKCPYCCSLYGNAAATQLVAGATTDPVLTLAFVNAMTLTVASTLCCPITLAYTALSEFSNRGISLTPGPGSDFALCLQSSWQPTFLEDM